MEIKVRDQSDMDAPDTSNASVAPSPVETTATEPQESESNKQAAPAPQTEPPVTSPQESTNHQESSADNNTASTSETPAIVVPPKQKKHLPVGLIVAVSLVTAILIGGVVFVYLKSNKQVAMPTTNQTSTTTQPKQEVTGEDVDTATQNIDKSLNSVDETKDFSNTELTDQSLGL